MRRVLLMLSRSPPLLLLAGCLFLPRSTQPPLPAPISPPRTVLPAAPPEYPRSVVVQPGDSLASIAQRELGDPSRYPEIYILNRALIGPDPNRLRAGQRLLLFADLGLDTLLAIMPALPRELGAAYLPWLNRAMWEFGITTPRRKACFLAQLAHESGELRYFEEHASGEAYEGRCEDLGNCAAGDGTRYKGRGPIQLTGRKNYRQAGAALGLDLEAEPELAGRREVGFRIAGWFFQVSGLNELAERDQFSEITRRINGGLLNEQQREMYWARARAALGL
jgi:predicted chitinase